MSSTKILVLHLKDLIYTAVFAVLGILLIILLIYMFSPKGTEATIQYQPGIYTSSVLLNDTLVNVEVKVEENEIASIRLVDLDTNLEIMYPLLQPTMASLEKQIVKNQDLEVTSTEDTRYTSEYLIDAVERALAKAAIER